MAEKKTSHVELFNRTRTRVPERRLKAFALRVMDLLPQARGKHVDITFVGEKRIKNLNRDYRGRDAVTDVLSFRLDDPDDPEPGPFGAVVICPRYAVAAARKEGMSDTAMFEELILHSLLHLTGSTHDTDAAHRAMQRRRARVLKLMQKT